jgi:nucleotidyltransferase/DNA polymerase involved in DNA repair
MSRIMEETQISKARMLGGKLGKRVLSLLPESETTMGSISRLLSLDRLEGAIGIDTARWVFDACRGIDHEEVKATLKVLPKSITVSVGRVQTLDCLSILRARSPIR